MIDIALAFAVGVVLALLVSQRVGPWLVGKLLLITLASSWLIVVVGVLRVRNAVLKAALDRERATNNYK